MLLCALKEDNNIMKTGISLIFFIFLSYSLTLYGEDGPKKDTSDYIAKLNNSFEVSGEYHIDFTHFALLDAEKERVFNYYPNMRGVVSFGARYKFLFFGYSFNLKENAIYDSLYGPTHFNQIAFGIKTRPVWFTFYYSKHKGFYISNENMLFPKFRTDSLYAQNNDLITLRLGTRLDIIFSKRFSMEAAFEYSKIQKKSAGSFVLRLNPEYNYIDAIHNPIIPQQYVSQFEGLEYYYKTQFFNFGLGLGYTYSIVKGPFNFSNFAMIGPTVSLYAYDGLEIDFPLLLNFKSSLSFNMKYCYIGVLASLDVQNYTLENNTIRKQNLAFMVRAGLRL
jgi:hypothetical protein